jgi:hypothetical protein
MRGAENALVPGSYSSGDVKKPANALRINKEFLTLLRNRSGEIGPTSLTLGSRVYTGPYNDRLWIVNADGYVRLRVDDPLLAIVRANLIRHGYLSREMMVSTKDDSAFVRALKTAYEEKRDSIASAGARGGPAPEIRATDRWWPSGINFGPNTNSNELRVHPQFLLEILIAPPAKSRTTALAALRGVKVKRPVLGTLPSVTGAHQRGALVVPRIQVSSAARAAAMTTSPTAPRLSMTAAESQALLRRLTGK